MCTGNIPKLESKVPLLPPQKILHNMMKNIGFKGKIGVFIPEKEQEQTIINAWTAVELDIVPIFASPYGNIKKIREETSRMDVKGISVIYMDCMGYSQRMKDIVHDATGLPVIIPRTMIVKLALELI